MSYRLSALAANRLPALWQADAGAEQWEERRKQILAVWKRYVGEMPEPTAPDMRILAKTQEADHVRLHITYATGFGDRVTAFLLLPSGCDGEQGGRRFPAVLALHPTHPSGKADIASPDARPNRAYGNELVARGFVVLAPDTITAGERIYEGYEAYQTAPFYEAFPQATAIGKMLHDHMQAIDVLGELPYVDHARIGAIGHSLGAYNAFMLAGWDRRIKAVAASCGLSSFAEDADPNRWGQREWFSHIPRLSEDIARDEVPFEMHEIAALCAPTPFFNWMGQTDHIFPHWHAIASASLEIDKLYTGLGYGERYRGLYGNTGHDFPEDIRRLAYDFLQNWLI